MKKLFLFFFLFSMALFSHAQDGPGSISTKEIPLELKLQIGVAFIYAVLGLLFLMLYLLYPRQRLHLFFGLYNICLLLLGLNSEFSAGKSRPVTEVTGDLNGLLSRLVGINILLFMLYALQKMRNFFWWFAAFILFVDFPLSIIFSGKYQYINEGVHAAFTITCVWLLLVAFRSKNREDYLIGFVAIAVVVINLGGILIFFNGTDLARSVVIFLVPFSITAAVVTYLALRYARANTSLELQLIQVKKLSEESLRHEYEKQQILANQNETLEKQVAERTVELKQSLDNLRSTQKQLIQSEKMASLGELTAGIAHEIQNPLNFVNNFSEVNKELLAEMKDEIDKGNLDEVKSIANDVIENQEKINHHGKRADAIVKGMLQHSRTSSGQKEPTDINALADEYLRLAYHGLRAKNKSFNAKFETAFDPSIGKISIVPQDMGRVILNLINNAFYAVTERKNQQQKDFEPTVTVGTKKMGNKVLISVKDNGNGIPQKISDKIFQPFFTTKPTGQGTGLGLSLSYDIIKAHGGELKVENKEGEGAAFIIEIPITQ